MLDKGRFPYVDKQWIQRQDGTGNTLEHLTRCETAFEEYDLWWSYPLEEIASSTQFRVPRESEINKAFV